MKSILLTPFLMLAACASVAPRKAAIVALAPPSPPVNVTGLRTGEQLREYRFGCYVDPGEPLVMHEGHPVYRVETSAGWNLRPGGGDAAPSRVTAAQPAVLANDAVVAEVNKQRAATRLITEQTTMLNQRIGEMTQAAARSQELGKQSLLLQRDITALRERMDSLEAQRPKPTAADRPQPRAEDKW